MPQIQLRFLSENDHAVPDDSEESSDFEEKREMTVKKFRDIFP